MAAPLTALLALTALSACSAPAGAPIQGTSQSVGMLSATRSAADRDRDRPAITCGSDRDDCNKIRLVAPLTVTNPRRTASLTDAVRMLALSLTAAVCDHARVDMPDGALPLSPQTIAIAGAGPTNFTVAPITDPCTDADQDSHADRDDHRSYVIVAFYVAADGSATVSTLTGPSTDTAGTLSFDPAVMQLEVGDYAFYLATQRSDDHSHKHDR